VGHLPGDHRHGRWLGEDHGKKTVDGLIGCKHDITKATEGLFALFWGPPPVRETTADGRSVWRRATPDDPDYQRAEEQARGGAAFLAHICQYLAPEKDPELVPDPNDPDYQPSDAMPNAEAAQGVQQTVMPVGPDDGPPEHTPPQRDPRMPMGPPQL
jgi:hypothetical protein